MITKEKAIAIRAQHVKAAVQKAVNLGGKASWNTEKHRTMVADVVYQSQASSVEEIVEVLSWVDNCSALAQDLEAKWAVSTGHFARRNTKTVKGFNELLAELENETKRM
jgi:hypothetical protein